MCHRCHLCLETSCRSEGRRKERKLSAEFCESLWSASSSHPRTRRLWDAVGETHYKQKVKENFVLCQKSTEKPWLLFRRDFRKAAGKGDYLKWAQNQDYRGPKWFNCSFSVEKCILIHHLGSNQLHCWFNVEKFVKHVEKVSATKELN